MVAAGGVLAWGIPSLTFLPFSWFRLSVVALVMTSCVAAWALERRGHIVAGVVVLFAGSHAALTASLVVFGGVDSSAVTGYFVLVLMVGLIFDGRGVMPVAALCAVTVAAVGLLEHSGALDAIPGPGSTVRDPLARVLLLGAALVLTAAFVKRLRGAVALAQTSGVLVAERDTELRASQERFAALANHAGDFILETDQRGRITYASSNHHGALGSPEQLEGREVRDLIHPDDRDRVQEAAAAALAGADTGVVTFRMRKEGDGWRWFEATLRRYRTSDGENRILGVYRDVTERIRAESARRSHDSERSRAEKMRALGRFAAGIAHDFSNFLSAISLHAEAVRDALPPSGPARNDADQILHAADRAGDLTRLLLSFGHRGRAEPRPVDLNAIVSDFGRLLELWVGENVRLSTSLGPDLAWIEADRSEIEQVLMNLVVNARDAMPTGGEIRIETLNRELRPGDRPRFRSLRPGSCVVLRVSDTGVGMDEETVSLIFEPFYTDKELGNGTGLGLSTVYGVVERCGGAIDVSSKKGEGTVFEILFPACAREREVLAAAEGRPPLVRGEATVLAVSGDVALLASMAKVLRDAGYHTIEARSESEAREAAARPEGSIDLLLTDVVVSGASATKLAERLREERADLRILYLGEPDQLGRDGQPRAHLLRKPFTADSLYAAVRGALDSPD